MIQTNRLRREFDVEFDWLAYELMPEGMEYGPPAAASPVPDVVPTPTLSRLQFLLMMDKIEIPAVERPRRVRTHMAHECVEYAKRHGRADALVQAIYRAFWVDGLDISDLEVLGRLGATHVDDVSRMISAAREKEFASSIIGFDEPAYASGVWHVPTFFVGEERLAEMPYVAVRAAMERFLGVSDAPYRSVDFPAAPAGRPYALIDMVATIDGKIVSGGRDEPVTDLGPKTDHAAMRNLEAAADAVLVGASTLRAAKPSWKPRTATRVVVTGSGHLPLGSAFFEPDARVVVAAPEGVSFELPEHVEVVTAGAERVDFSLLARLLRERGVGRLLVLGGSTVNGQMLSAGLIDEIFLTVAPKVKLGRGLPTMAEGEAFPREALATFCLVSGQAFGDEMFLRYRRT